MNFEEHAAKALLKLRGLPVPQGTLVTNAADAAAAAQALGGPCVVKAQAPTGKRGKAGGIRLAGSVEEAQDAATEILGMDISGHTIERLLIEEQVPIASEFYAAALNDSASRGPVVLFSTMGGMNVEEAAAQDSTAMRRVEVDIASGLSRDQALAVLKGLDLDNQDGAVADFLVSLYDAYRALDADLLEINPLVLTDDRRVIALDCKYTLDDSSTERQGAAAEDGSPDPMTVLEAEAHASDLKYIELGGEVGVLANGAGLTMTTMDAITHYGGAPANFLEIGGEAYTKAETALTILLKNPNIKSLLVNFCGAFARTDVMAGGVVDAWKKIDPDIPIFFTIHGTGEEEAIDLVRRELGQEPFDLMDDAVRAAVHAAQGSAA